MRDRARQKPVKKGRLRRILSFRNKIKLYMLIPRHNYTPCRRAQVGSRRAQVGCRRAQVGGGRRRPGALTFEWCFSNSSWKTDPSTPWLNSATLPPNCIRNARNWKPRVRARGTLPYIFNYLIPWLSELSNMEYFVYLISPQMFVEKSFWKSLMSGNRIGMASGVHKVSFQQVWSNLFGGPKLKKKIKGLAWHFLFNLGQKMTFFLNSAEIPSDVSVSSNNIKTPTIWMICAKITDFGRTK